MEKNGNKKAKQTEINSDSFVMVNHEDSFKNESITSGENILQINNSQSIFCFKIIKKSFF